MTTWDKQEEARLMAFSLGELPAEERAAVERWLVESAAARAGLDEISRFADCIRGALAEEEARPLAPLPPAFAEEPAPRGAECWKGFWAAIALTGACAAAFALAFSLAGLRPSRPARSGLPSVPTTALGSAAHDRTVIGWFSSTNGLPSANPRVSPPLRSSVVARPAASHSTSDPRAHQPRQDFAFPGGWMGEALAFADRLTDKTFDGLGAEPIDPESSLPLAQRVTSVPTDLYAPMPTNVDWRLLQSRWFWPWTAPSPIRSATPRHVRYYPPDPGIYGARGRPRGPWLPSRMGDPGIYGNRVPKAPAADLLDPDFTIWAIPRPTSMPADQAPPKR